MLSDETLPRALVPGAQRAAAAAGLAALLAASAGAAQTLEGFIEPYEEVEVAAPEPGVIAELSVEEGRAVKAGQVLAILDNRLLEAALAVAHARKAVTGPVDAARADVRRKKRLLERLEALQSSGSARTEEVDEARAAFEIAAAELKTAQESRHIAELEYARIEAQMEHRTLRSPIDGVVTEVHRERGELVTMAVPWVMRISRLDKLRIVAHVPVTQSDQIAVGRELAVTVPDSGAAVTAIVEYVDPVADPRSGTVVVRLAFDNDGARIRSGQRAVAELP